MAPLFIYGTLCHLPLLHMVLGRDPAIRPACLPDHAVHWAEGGNFPMIKAARGAVARGVLIEDLDAEDRARLDFYEGPYGYETTLRNVMTGEGEEIEALVYFPHPGLWQPAASWSLQDWVRDWGAIVVATAGDMMAHYPVPVPDYRRRPMLVRGASRVLAARSPAPTRIRRRCEPGDIRITARREPYARFFAVEEYDLSWREFDGGFSREATRAIFLSGDAVTVLPYDPVRDRVLLVEQFRMGPFGRGDPQPWLLEPIAGRIDPGETPEEAARREAMEEAGLVLSDLIPIRNYYPSPGAKAEYHHSFLAVTDLPDDAAIVGGEDSEIEDIKGHLLSFEVMMELLGSGELNNAPMLISALWLERERSRLRNR
ncbi:MAG: NUDIX domain-containing protein [Pseudorhodobacter sp.]